MSINPDTQFLVYAGLQAATAVGTVGAVIVAVFGTWLRARLYPPKLRLTLSNLQGVKVPGTIRGPEGDEVWTEQRWYHVRVENDRRWAPCSQVQVLVLQVSEPDARGQLRPTWIGELPLRWRHSDIGSPFRAVGRSAECDLCSVLKSAGVFLHPMILRDNFRDHWSGAARIALTIQARGVEADSNVLTVQIDFDGQWQGSDLHSQQHLRIKTLS